MADPANAAAAAAANDDDVDDLYAGLDDQVTAALTAAGESGGSNARDSDPATDAEADANEAVDLSDGLAGYSSSDEESEDDLHIVLNEDGCAPRPPPDGRCEEGLGDENEEGEAPGSLAKGPSVTNGGRGKLGGLHCKGPVDKTALPITGLGDRGHQQAFQKDFYFSLSRNRTVFDINIEAFHQKPWRQHGVDLTDYFNFGLDEEGWRKYSFGMKQFRQGARSLADESPGLVQESHYNLESTKLMPKPATYAGFEERNDLTKPKGRAIHVEGGVFERMPSADVWRPRERDSDVVIQVNTMLSPLNQSSSDDSSTLNYKRMTTERLVDKEVHNGGSSEYTGCKLAIRDSACTRDQSLSPNYSDMLSEESTKDCYPKRARRHSKSKAFCADTKLYDLHAKTYSCRHSSKSDQESSRGDSLSYRSSPADDRYQKTTEHLRMNEPHSMSGGYIVDYQSDRRLLKSRRKITTEPTRQSSAGGRHAVFEKQEKNADNYPSRRSRKYEEKRSISSFITNNYRSVVRKQVCEEQDYSPHERASLRNDTQFFRNNSNHQWTRSSWHEINDEEDVVERFSSAKRWQQHRDHGHGYNSMLKAEPCDDFDGRMYRENYYQGTRRVRHGHSEDDEFLHCTDYRLGELLPPEIRDKYRKRKSPGSNNEHLRHPYHLMVSPRANDYLNNSERDRPADGLTLSSRNRFIQNKRIRNAKLMQYHHGGYYEKNKHRDSSFRVDNIQESSLHTAAETDYCSLPVKRKLHADLGSMDCKDLVGLSFPKGRRLIHDQCMVSDRKLYATKVHNSSKEIGREAICNFDDMRNSNTITSIRDERRHEVLYHQPKNADNIYLNNRKRKFMRQGNEIRREVQSGNDGCVPADKSMGSSRRKDAHQKVQKSTCQKRQNVVSLNEEDEIEEGELIEEEHQDAASKSKLNKPRKGVLKSVVEASSAGQLEVTNAMPKEDVCGEGSTRECDTNHILQVMEKMQKRRQRFQEPIATATQKEEDAAALNAGDIRNQRPTRKRRWGGSG